MNVFFGVSMLLIAGGIAGDVIFGFGLAGDQQAQTGWVAFSVLIGMMLQLLSEANK